MISLEPSVVNELPVDELALKVLSDLVKTGEWNEYNYLNSASQHLLYQRDQAAQRAIAEALTWLRNRGLIARTPGQNNADSIFVTRAGNQALTQGLARVRATHQLQEGLHAQIEGRARRQFLLGEYEQAVFVAMKAVEARVRELGGYSDDDFGVKLMNNAFGPTGPLTDPQATPGEKEGMRGLFMGAYAVLRNTSGHREVDYDNVAEAAESVIVASLLMRMLDRIERTLRPPAD